MKLTLTARRPQQHIPRWQEDVEPRIRPCGARDGRFLDAPSSY